MIFWKKTRISFLVLIFGSVFFVLGKSILAPISSFDAATTLFVFPSKVPLTGWQPIASRPLIKETSESPKLIAGSHYQYARNGRILDIEMRYLSDTNGDVKGFIQHYTSLVSPLTLRQQERVGFYGLIIDRRRVYLSACINPRGGTTVTAQQFRHNRYLYDVRLNRLLSWLLGREPLRDNRCLWAHLFISLQNSSPEAAEQILKSIWFSWYEWWQPRFPKLLNSSLYKSFNKNLSNNC